MTTDTAPPGSCYLVHSYDGVSRHWWADSEDHALEQHLDAFPDEPISSIEHCPEIDWRSYSGQAG